MKRVKMYVVPHAFLFVPYMNQSLQISGSADLFEALIIVNWKQLCLNA